jgi:hypothetical protein
LEWLAQGREESTNQVTAETGVEGLRTEPFKVTVAAHEKSAAPWMDIVGIVELV